MRLQGLEYKPRCDATCLYIVRQASGLPRGAAPCAVFCLHGHSWQRTALPHCCRAHNMPALIATIARSVWKVPRDDLRWPQIFYFRKSESRQLSPKLVRFEIIHPRFAHLGYVRRTLLVADVHFRRRRMRRIAGIEYHMCAGGQARDEAKCPPCGLRSQIRHHAQPSEKGLQRRIKTSRLQPVRQTLPLEIHWRERKISW